MRQRWLQLDEHLLTWMEHLLMLREHLLMLREHLLMLCEAFALVGWGVLASAHQLSPLPVWVDRFQLLLHLYTLQLLLIGSVGLGALHLLLLVLGAQQLLLAVLVSLQLLLEG
jgi:hypothetical protein